MTLRHILCSSTLILFGLGASHAAFASPPSPAELSQNLAQNSHEVKINDASSGTLMFHTQTAGRYIEAPLVATDVKMDIAGPVIRATLSQTFENNSDEWIEGIYVFPLPENAAVDRLRLSLIHI